MKSIFFIFLLTLLTSVSASKFVPLDIDNGKWNVEMNFNNMLNAEQKAQMKLAMAKLEELKKNNPEMAAQLAKVTKGLGVENGTISKATCMTKESMGAEMDKMLSQESSSDSKCVGEVIKSTPKMVEGKTTCGKKTHHYKIMVDDAKHMTSEITTSEGKKIHGKFTWQAAECKDTE